MAIYLKPNDFVLENGELRLKKEGFSFVFFKTTACLYCNDVMPAFREISKRIQGCNFCEMDVYQNNSELVQMASKSTTPLTYVPYLLLYWKGRPIEQFKPNESDASQNTNLMMQFFMQQHEKVSKNIQQPPTHPEISQYSIGIPGNHKGRVCRLTYEAAYQ